MNKNVAFTDLSFFLLVAGELEISADCKSPELKRRPALLKKIVYYNTTYSIEGWLFVGPTGVYLLDFFCSGIQFNLLLSPYPCFISLLYLDLYVLGDDALIS